MVRFACGYVLRFTDGGHDEEQVLHIGTKEECERLAEQIPAVAYGGGRPVRDAAFVIVELPRKEEPAARSSSPTR